jgi:hypothetical protein
MGNSKFIFISLALGSVLAACEDPRSATEQLEPWLNKTVELAWQGPRPQDHALVFTTNLEFVVVKKLAEPRTVCSATSGNAGTATVETEVMGETEVQVPGETQTICEEQNTMDVTRTSRVNVVLKPKRGAKKLDPSAVQEVVLGYHAKDALKEALATREQEPGEEDTRLLEKITPSDDTVLALKAQGLKLTGLNVRLGDGTRFEPGDDIQIEATVEPASTTLSTVGSPVALPQFKSNERQALKAGQP